MAAATHEVVTVPAAVYYIQEWIQTFGRDFRSNGTLIKELALEMRKHDIPVDRIWVGTMLTHPQASAWVYKWESINNDVTEVPISKDIYDRRFEVGGLDAPMHQMERGVESLRVRATDEDIPENSRDQFTERGYVDMYCRRLNYRGEFAGGITFNTKDPSGWSEHHISVLDSILPALTTVVMLHLNEACTHSLLCTYLGKDPGNRVFQGSIERGQGRSVRAIVWFSDVRGFTKMSGELPRDALIALINDVFEATENALSRHGGDVLKYMGDGLMGVFTEEGEEFHEEVRGSLMLRRPSAPSADLFRNAREAAAELQLSLCKIREDRASKGLPGADLQVGIGLHYGDVSYGNIGAPGRLDFTVIGPSVNLASRVEGLCGKLKASVLATDEFVRRDEQVDAWKSLGQQEVKGVPEPIEVFELAQVER